MRLGLVIALTLAFFLGERLKEVTMKTARGETTRNLMKAFCAVGLKVVGFILLTTGMIGTSMVAAMLLPPTHRRATRQSGRPFPFVSLPDRAYRAIRHSTISRLSA